MKTKYKFAGRMGDRYYWRAPADYPGYEEICSCNVDWFWGQA